MFLTHPNFRRSNGLDAADFLARGALSAHEELRSPQTKKAPQGAFFIGGQGGIAENSLWAVFRLSLRLRSLGFASRPKSPAGDFVEHGFVHLTPSASKKGPARGPFCWRTGWDLNPRYACTYAAFRVRCLQPLDHLSAGGDMGTGSGWQV